MTSDATGEGESTTSMALKNWKLVEVECVRAGKCKRINTVCSPEGDYNGVTEVKGQLVFCYTILIHRATKCNVSRHFSAIQIERGVIFTV